MRTIYHLPNACDWSHLKWACPRPLYQTTLPDHSTSPRPLYQSQTTLPDRSTSPRHWETERPETETRPRPKTVEAVTRPRPQKSGLKTKTGLENYKSTPPQRVHTPPTGSAVFQGLCSTGSAVFQ